MSLAHSTDKKIGGLHIGNKGRVWLPASSPTRPAQEGCSPFGCLDLLLGLHRTLLKAAQSLARWKYSNRQFLASQAEPSASERALARVETGGMRGD